MKARSCFCNIPRRFSDPRSASLAVLDAHDGHDRLRVLDLPHGHFRQADVLDLAFRLQVLDPGIAFVVRPSTRGEKT